jgi:3-methyladenine DNA glycosylase AlkD
MDLKTALAKLESFGTAQNRKVYARHGVGPAMYGVSFANLKALAKQIRRDQGLAESLWATGNHDARMLATMVADPAAMTLATLDRWRMDLDNYVLTDAVSGLAADMGLPRKTIDAWCESDNEWSGALGWSLVGRMAALASDVPDDYFMSRIAVIEREIHDRRNRTKHAMNSALIGIGLRSPGLKKAAIAAAKRIGRVDVDHGETGCKTPDAAMYIQKASAHRSKQRTAAAPAGKRAARPKRAGAR